MKLKYLGTAAAEGFPAVFCRCEYCLEARKLKGKNVRTRSQTLINDNLLIDLPADTYMHFLNNDIEGDKIKYLLVTHSHSDHFYYEELQMRFSPYAHNMRQETLELFCGQGVYDKIMANGVPENVKVEKLLPFNTREIGDYRVTAFPANHMKGDGALFYMIESDKTLLYAHDTGYFTEDVLGFMETKKLKFDMISFDCTNVDIPISDEGSHMGLDNIERLMKKLSEMGCIDENTILYINHFSHNANPIHHILEERVKDMNLQVSYDGLEVEI